MLFIEVVHHHRQWLRRNSRNQRLRAICEINLQQRVRRNRLQVVFFCKVSAERKEAFDRLKSALLEAPVLRLADVSRPFGGHTDASNNTLAAVLLQSDPDDPEDYHPISYLSRNISSAEKNFTIAEKERLAVIYALKNLRLYLFKHLEVFSGNKGVIYLSSTPHLSQREARWVEFLTDFDYSIYDQHGHEYLI